MYCEKCHNLIGEGQPYCCSNECLTRHVLKIEKNPKGGYWTYFETSKYPLNFYPIQENLCYVDTLKKVLIASLRLVSCIPLTPHKIIVKSKNWMGDIYSADTNQHPDRFKLDDLASPSQEILRCLILTEKTDDTRWCWYLTVVLDTDLAYGLRLRDVLQELNKEALKKNPKREIIRLVDICIARDKVIREKLVMMRRLLKIAFLSKEFRNIIVTFLENLDIEKIRFDLNDKYWLANKFDYNYEGKTYEKRMVWKNAEDKDWKFEEIAPEKPRIAINPPNQAFYDLTAEEAQTMIVETAKVIRDDWVKHQKNAEIARKN